MNGSVLSEYVKCAWSCVVIGVRTAGWEGGTEKWRQLQGEKGNRADLRGYKMFRTIRDVLCTIVVNLYFFFSHNTLIITSSAT